MKLGVLEVQNFMSIVSATMNFDSKGLVLIQGENSDSEAFESNGSGKSTLFSEAPTWTLYGETIRGQKGDKVVNRTAGKNTRCSLQIIDDNGEVYTVVRHRKHSQYKNTVQLFKGDNNITGKSDTDTNQMIIDLLEMDYLTFTNSIMFGQGVTKMFASSTDKEQKAILEKMLQIDVYKHCQELAKEKLKEVNEQYNKLTVSQETTRTLKEAKENTLKELQISEAELDSKCDKAIAEYQVKLVSLEEQLKEYETALKSDELVMDLANVDRLITKVTDTIDKYAEVREAYADAQAKELTIGREIKSLNDKIKSDTEKLDDIKQGQNVPKTCSTCGQDLPLNDTTHIENHLQSSIENDKKVVLEKVAELEVAKETTEEFKTKLADLPKHESNLRKLRETRYEITSSIKKLKIDIKDTEGSIDDIKAEISKQEELKKSTFTEAIESTIKSIEEYKKDLSTAQAELGELLSTKEDYEFWVDAYGNSGIKSILLDSVVPFLDSRANDYLKVLADSSIEVKFHTQQLVKSTKEYKDKFSVEVMNRNGDDDYKSNSGGEKRRIDIAINMTLQDLALSRSNKRMDIIVYDEVFESLDELGSQKVIELLEAKAKEVGTVLVITHNDSLKQLFSQSIEVVKNNGETEVRYNE